MKSTIFTTLALAAIGVNPILGAAFPGNAIARRAYDASVPSHGAGPAEDAGEAPAEAPTSEYPGPEETKTENSGGSCATTEAPASEEAAPGAALAEAPESSGSGDKGGSQETTTEETKDTSEASSESAVKYAASGETSGTYNTTPAPKSSGETSGTYNAIPAPTGSSSGSY
ncbi:hypothetical protein DSO57_1013390 [Entomophthora muscae]|uniref:Uncharacterized protein n=1 Tax=Entomophthora muscae TaxID=34485 RepID=A0ACC2S7N2_9FUNG|nr:hypothetical protein DSO57_1013390 [Entomophthora muscae]